MRKEEITEEVIRLSNEIAEVWRMEIYVGCWIEDDGGELVLVRDLMDMTSYYTRSGIIPIPDIADVLGKLRKEYYFIADQQEKSIKYAVSGIIDGFLNVKKVHEILLSALLKVLKEVSDE